MYEVIKTIPSHPGPRMKTAVPEREVTMSRHRTEAAATKAMVRYDRSHRGYASFRVVRT